MIQSRIINKVKVTPVITNQDYEDPEKILGYDHFARLYSNIGLISKKASGKTSVIYHILKNCVNRKTRVIVFCPTVDLDATYVEIFKMLDKKKVQYEKYTSLYDDEDGSNLLEGIISDLQKEAGAKDPEEKKPEKKLDPYFQELEKARSQFFVQEKTEPDSKSKKRKPKKISPKVAFVFDDLSSDLRNKSIATLLKKMRHFKSKVILSSQTLSDLDNGARSQLDYFLCFKSMTPDQLEVLSGNLNLRDGLQGLQRYYDYATKDPYNFLYVDVRRDLFRKNFNELLE